MDSFLALFDLVGEVGRRRQYAAEKCYSVIGLSHSEARLLSLLEWAGGTATQDALSNLVYLDRSNSGRTLRRLEQAGYVVRRKDDTDKRANVVRISAKGRKAVIEVMKLRKKLAQRFFSGLEENEADSITILLRKVIAARGDEPR
jgi:DNA-binding MarR family transcriptional regulator